MISKLDARIVTDISNLLREKLRWCSLLEYYPTDYNADVEIRTKTYARQLVQWEGLGAGLLVNSNVLEFSGLEDPTMVMAVGLHTEQFSSSVNAWGALGKTMRATNNRLIIPKRALAVRIG